MADFVFDSEDDFSFKLNSDPQMYLNQNTQKKSCTFWKYSSMRDGVCWTARSSGETELARTGTCQYAGIAWPICLWWGQCKTTKRHNYGGFCCPIQSCRDWIIFPSTKTQLEETTQANRDERAVDCRVSYLCRRISHIVYNCRLQLIYGMYTNC